MHSSINSSSDASNSTSLIQNSPATLVSAGQPMVAPTPIVSSHSPSQPVMNVIRPTSNVPKKRTLTIHNRKVLLRMPSPNSAQSSAPSNPSVKDFSSGQIVMSSTGKMVFVANKQVKNDIRLPTSGRITLAQPASLGIRNPGVTIGMQQSPGTSFRMQTPANLDIASPLGMTAAGTLVMTSNGTLAASSPLAMPSPGNIVMTSPGASAPGNVRVVSPGSFRLLSPNAVRLSPPIPTNLAPQYQPQDNVHQDPVKVVLMPTSTDPSKYYIVPTSLAAPPGRKPIISPLTDASVLNPNKVLTESFSRTSAMLDQQMGRISVVDQAPLVDNDVVGGVNSYPPCIPNATPLTASTGHNFNENLVGNNLSEVHTAMTVPSQQTSDSNCFVGPEQSSGININLANSRKEEQKSWTCVDLSLDFKSVKLSWLAGTIKKSILTNIQEVSLKNKDVVTFSVNNSTVRDAPLFGFARTKSVLGDASLLLLGSSVEDIKIASELAFEKLFIHSGVKYYMKDASGDVASFVYHSHEYFLKVASKKKNSSTVSGLKQKCLVKDFRVKAVAMKAAAAPKQKENPAKEDVAKESPCSCIKAGDFMCFGHSTSGQTSSLDTNSRIFSSQAVATPNVTEAASPNKSSKKCTLVTLGGMSIPSVPLKDSISKKQNLSPQSSEKSDSISVNTSPDTKSKSDVSDSDSKLLAMETDDLDKYDALTPEKKPSLVKRVLSTLSSDDSPSSLHLSLSPDSSNPSPKGKSICSFTPRRSPIKLCQGSPNKPSCEKTSPDCVSKRLNFQSIIPSSGECKRSRNFPSATSVIYLRTIMAD